MKGQLTFDGLIKKLDVGFNFSMSRWGDGEFKCMRQRGGQNCDGHKYYDGLGEQLIAAFNHSAYKKRMHIGIQPLAVRVMGDEVQEWQNNVHPANPYFNADIIHNASIHGELNRLFNVLSDREVVYIAPERFVLFNKFKFKHIVIPDVNCWLFYQQTLETIEKCLKKDTVLLYSSSMMSNVLIDELYEPYITQIDIGSAFEPYIGNQNRKYHKQIIENLQK